MKQSLIVDKDRGPFKKIQKAIDIAQPGDTILINNGLYFENLQIKTKNLKLQAQKNQKEVIIMTDKYPTIKIELQQDEECFLEGLKLSHYGSVNEVQQFQSIQFQILFIIFRDEIQDEIYQNKDKDNVFQGFQQKLQILRHDQTNFLQYFDIHYLTNCALYVQGGKVKMNNSFISLNFIVKQNAKVVYGVACDENSSLQLTECEIKGNNTKDTIGIFSRWANIEIDKCYIHTHQKGGILIESHKFNKVRILNSKVKNNVDVGINVCGAESQPLIFQNMIESNFGNGILISVGNQAKIEQNEIKYNDHGIKTISANPFIFYNKIFENRMDGINSECFLDFCQYGIIESNEIIGNSLNGIFCEGQYNFTKIIKNPFIGLNDKAGIYIGLQSQVIIEKNIITKNINQGILLSETSSAIIIGNEITNNIKANIAYGGNSQIDTFIVNNLITGSVNEGIFYSEGNKSYIARNVIQNNNDGIVCHQANPLIIDNDISQNKSNGIIILNHSNPIIDQNSIYDNDGIGLFIRKQNQVEMKNNKITMNEINMAIEQKFKGIQDITKNNEIDGDITAPTENQCIIF